MSSFSNTLVGVKSLPNERLEKAAELILNSVGEEITREGLEKTPERFAKAMREMCSGYTMTLSEAVGEGVFGAEGQGLVTVKDVEFYSFCEHHMLPFFGKISVAYYPHDKILGLSKIPRIIEMYARRYQVQERLTRQVAEAIQSSIGPRAVVVRATASHMCMMMRGVKKQQSETSTEFALGLEKLPESERSRIWSGI
jgi:GTP cyclohydrolase I